MNRATEDVQIAIIDDDECLCLSMVDLISSNGYGAKAFPSAELFLESGKFCRWNCIISDVHLPGMSGFELLSECRQRGVTAPIILITALPDQEFDGPVPISAFCLLRKPFRANMLLDCVRRGLQDTPQQSIQPD
jgi:FixJ family two-component response regulator